MNNQIKNILSLLPQNLTVLNVIALDESSQGTYKVEKFAELECETFRRSVKSQMIHYTSLDHLVTRCIEHRQSNNCTFEL